MSFPYQGEHLLGAFSAPEAVPALLIVTVVHLRTLGGEYLLCSFYDEKIKAQRAAVTAWGRQTASKSPGSMQRGQGI